MTVRVAHVGSGATVGHHDAPLHGRPRLPVTRIRAETAADPVAGPRIITAGPAFASHGPGPVNRGASALRAAVRERGRYGCDLVAVKVGDYSVGELWAVVAEDSGYGLPVVAHAGEAAGLEHAIDASVDTIEHTAALATDAMRLIYQFARAPIAVTALAGAGREGVAVVPCAPTFSRVSTALRTVGASLALGSDPAATRRGPTTSCPRPWHSSLATVRTRSTSCALRPAGRRTTAVRCAGAMTMGKCDVRRRRAVTASSSETHSLPLAWCVRRLVPTSSVRRDLAKFHDQFAADLEPADAILLGRTQRPVTEIALPDGPATVTPAWQTRPTWQVFGTADRNISVESAGR
jgi:hypothetical protein